MAILKGVDIIEDGTNTIMVIDGDFKVVSAKISESYGKDIKRFLDGKDRDFEVTRFDEKRNIIHRGGNNIIVEYSDAELWSKEKELHKTNFKERNVHFSEELEGGIQIGELCGTIEYKGKYYLILDGLNKLIDRVDNIVYRGIIVNISRFTDNPVSDNIKSTESKVGDILSQ